MVLSKKKRWKETKIMYDARDYKFTSYLDCINDTYFNEVFPIMDVMNDYGLDLERELGLHKTGNGYRCICPYHDGDKKSTETMRIDPVENTAFSYPLWKRYNPIDIVMAQKGYFSKYARREAFIDLCNFYGRDPEEFKGIVKRDNVKDKDNKNKEEIKKPVEPPKPLIFLTSAQLTALRLSITGNEIGNPFLNRNYKKGNKDKSKEKEAVYLTDRQCATVLAKAVLELEDRVNCVLDWTKWYKSHAFTDDIRNIDKKMLSPTLENYIYDTFSWCTDIYKKCKEIGFEKVPDEIYESRLKHAANERTYTRDYEEIYAACSREDMEKAYTEVDSDKVSKYPSLPTSGPYLGIDKSSLMEMDGKTFIIPLDDFLRLNIDRMSDYEAMVHKYLDIFNDLMKPFEADAEEEYMKVIDAAFKDGQAAIDLNAKLDRAYIILLGERAKVPEFIRDMEKEEEIKKENPINMVDKEIEEEEIER